MPPLLRLLLSAVVGLGFFVAPVRVDGRWTVAFDVVVGWLRAAAPEWVSGYALFVVAVGACCSLWALRSKARAWLAPFRAPLGFVALRVVGLWLGVLLALGSGPAWLHAKATGGLMWGTLVTSVAVIVPVGAVMLNLLAGYGCLELVGVVMRPLMRPLFRLPGRAALDDVTSWLGSYSVGLYLTRRLLDQGRYTRREAFTIATCFSTVSVGFVGVVASTLDLLPLFPLIFVTYFVLIYLVAAVQVRVWPTTAVADTCVVAPDPEQGGDGPLLARALREAVAQARAAPPMPTLMWRGLRDGFVLSCTILGTILTVGLAAVLLAEHTPLFGWLGAPVVPLLELLGLPDAAVLGPAVTAGVTEMYVPALLAKDASVAGRFFVCELSISQLIFFSSVGPMMLDMFRDVPIRVRDLLAVFALRTALLVPLLAAVTAGLEAAGAFAGME